LYKTATISVYETKQHAKITDYKEFTRREKGRTVQQEQAAIAKHNRRQEKRKADARQEMGPKMKQLKLPTVGKREELAAAMKVTPSEVVPKADDDTVMNVPYGDNSLLPKGVNHTRVALCNLNGIPPHDEYAKAKEVG
jgi:hypothetical protein